MVMDRRRESNTKDNSMLECKKTLMEREMFNYQLLVM